jgi:hypothetical protein
MLKSCAKTWLINQWLIGYKFRHKNAKNNKMNFIKVKELNAIFLKQKEKSLLIGLLLSELLKNEIL